MLVYAADPTLVQHWVDVLCLLGVGLHLTNNINVMLVTEPRSEEMGGAGVLGA